MIRTNGTAGEFETFNLLICDVLLCNFNDMIEVNPSSVTEELATRAINFNTTMKAQDLHKQLSQLSRFSESKRGGLLKFTSYHHEELLPWHTIAHSRN